MKISDTNIFTERQIEIMQAATQRIDKHGIQDLTIKNLAADLELSEAALYRHFKSKNDILMGLLNYFILEMEVRLSAIISQAEVKSEDLLKQVFDSQLGSFVKNPAIVSVIFSEGIFQFNKDLNTRIMQMMKLMQLNIQSVISKGIDAGQIREIADSSTITTIIMGSMRMTVLKWKLSGHKSNLIHDGTTVLSGILNMIRK
ncbi:MAG: TetR family transcriptional regulator [Sphingobacteriales bacterium 17-39-43]|uniref:TetR/AcrR family transcriptional regulator n=1 Tax=Daejeonella sp. TaxID=2805397 RepID=UPI000BD814D9|nr:TetR/AcrR family transcriptional regulator [Daejeonella sp.]OYZ29842.1 MAG: TetR family transcriptional regulator [Sphingobacteriales bacterium 16-39-50]OZA22714.1 MAG: TetR family transcriptional regulator [Sphingobacteriales bacterium 17-39-43]HQT24339.1 TetR/AcrR family transcriptional regulator [Daejeonella sp.]HQT59132.1 TetR/AcrR family transcriptional regulator [Daejeonella sp.]